MLNAENTIIKTNKKIDDALSYKKYSAQISPINKKIDNALLSKKYSAQT